MYPVGSYTLSHVIRVDVVMSSSEQNFNSGDIVLYKWILLRVVYLLHSPFFVTRNAPNWNDTNNAVIQKKLFSSFQSSMYAEHIGGPGSAQA